MTSRFTALERIPVMIIYSVRGREWMRDDWFWTRYTFNTNKEFHDCINAVIKEMIDTCMFDDVSYISVEVIY